MKVIGVRGVVVRPQSGTEIVTGTRLSRFEKPTTFAPVPPVLEYADPTPILEPEGRDIEC